MLDRVFSFIDLFAGAGGLSEGFISQGNFRPIAHVEMKADACDTLRTRTCYYYLRENGRLEFYERYLRGEVAKEELYAALPRELLDTVINRTIEDNSVESIFSEIDEAIRNGQRPEVDLIIGGPPCQAYSLVGRAVDANGMRNDPRNFLYLQYVRFLRKYRPRVFVFENVPGILNANKGETFREIRKAFEESGYKIEYQIQDSADYGVLQHRKRVIIVGWKNELNYRYPEFHKNKYDAIVSDLFCDLVPLKGGTEDNRYLSESSSYLRDSGIRSGNDILTQHLCRRNNERDVEIYRRTIEAWRNGHLRLKYASLPEELKTRKNQTSFPDRYKVVAGDLSCSHTMIAHIARDGHYFIHPDIEQGRSISVREAARIQSFPDNYFFEGSRAAKYTQIGNAVPPLMAKSIAQGIYNMLNGG